MNVLRSLCSALLMYSRIPAPHVEWKEENRRFALCFFPVIGIVIGGIFLIWAWICRSFNIGNVLFSAVSCVIPIFVCGGIHLDGFCDVIDAKSSNANRQRKLEIMSDPHIGSFAAIGLAVYFLLQFGLFSCVNSFETSAVIACSYALSRSLSALAAMTFKSAKKEGALQSFVKPAHKRISIVVLSVLVVIICSEMAALSLFSGIGAILMGGIAFLYYRVFSYKNFGGITGDTAGYFLQICELAMLGGAVIAEILRGLFI